MSAPTTKIMSVALVGARMCPYGTLAGTEVGGMQTFMRQILDRVATRGIETTLYTSNHRGACLADETSAVKVVHLQGAGDRYSVTDFTRNLLRYVKQNARRHDIVYSHYWTSAIAGRRMANLCGAPHIVSFHTLAETKQRHRSALGIPYIRLRAERAIARSADLVVAWTRDELDTLCRYQNANCNNIAVIPPGVDTLHFRPLDKSTARHRLGIDAKLTILYVGRLDEIKGTSILLDAFQKLGDSQDLQLHIVTPTDPSSHRMSQLRSSIQKLGISDRVVVWSGMSHSELLWHYAAADVFVMPSYYESFGLAALEAEACGIPVVASRVGGLKSVVRDGSTGYLVPWSCPEPFANALQTILDNSALRLAMGGASRRHAETFDWNLTVRRLVETFKILKETPRPTSVREATLI